jgi:hypothetical protein
MEVERFVNSMRRDAPTRKRSEVTTVHVEWPMNDHDAMTVRVAGTNESRQIVECDSPELAETLRNLPSGAAVPIRMESLGTRGNAWRALAFGPGSAVEDATPTSRPKHGADDDHTPEEEHGEYRETAEV